MPKPLPCTDYPYQTPMPLNDFLADNEKKIAKISRRLDKAYKHPGDFTAQVSVMLDDFALEAKARGRLENEVTVVIENKGELQRLDEYFRERPENGDILMDLLGCYIPAKKQIAIFMPTLVACAQKLDARIPSRFGYPCAMTLFYMVFLHELAHALHHLMLGLKPRENLRNSLEAEEAEKLAQHFTMTCIEKYGNRAKEVFLELENHQPSIYQRWRDLGPCEWENCKSQYEKNEEVKIYNKFKHLPDDDQNTASDLLDV